MKPFLALSCRALLLLLILNEGVECRPIQGTKRKVSEAPLLSTVAVNGPLQRLLSTDRITRLAEISKHCSHPIVYALEKCERAG